MLHDTREREAEFGVWKLWEEVKDEYPSFEFLNEHGLGMLLVGRQPDPRVSEFVALANAQRDAIRGLFSALGERVSLLDWGRRLEAENARLAVRAQTHATSVAEVGAQAEKIEAQLAAITESRAWRLTAWPRRMARLTTRR